MQRAIAEQLDDDTIPRHIRTMRRTYARRRDHPHSLRRPLPLATVPNAGGLALWCRTEVDADLSAENGLHQGIFV